MSPDAPGVAVFGTIYGDIVGSYYENTGVPATASMHSLDLITPHARITDDSITTIALADAATTPRIGTWGMERRCARALISWTQKYPGRDYGPLFEHWASQKTPSRRQVSGGNGAVMRIGAVSLYPPRIMEHMAQCMTAPSHYTPEALACARICAILYRNLIQYPDNRIQHIQQACAAWCDTFHKPLPDIEACIRERRIFGDAEHTTGLTLHILRSCHDFDTAIGLAIRANLDCDTQAAMVGGFAAQVWGIPDRRMIRIVIEHLDHTQQAILHRFAPEAVETFGGHDTYHQWLIHP